MSNNIVKIHGNDYMTVAGRVQLAHESKKDVEIYTEVLFQEPVVVKATVKVSGRVFTGISAANPSKAIEKMSPYEVAETSAVGRALGFAGFGSVESIATADEMVKATQETTNNNDFTYKTMSHAVKKAIGQMCPDCGVGKIVLNPKTNKLFCDQRCWLGKKPAVLEEEITYNDEDMNA